MNLLILLVGMIGVGFSASFNTIAMIGAGFTGFQCASGRLILAGAIMFCVPYYWKTVGQLRTHKKVMVFGAFFLAAHFALWTGAFAFTSPTSAVMFLCVQPLFSMILTRKDKKEKATGPILLGMVLGMVGLVMLAVEDFKLDKNHLIGDFMVILACLVIVLYQLVTRKVNKAVPWAAFNGTVWALSGLMLLPLAWPMPVDGDVKGWGAVAGLVFICTLVGHGCFNRVIPRLKLILINMAILGEPVVAVIILKGLGLDELPTGVRLVGALTVVLGVGVAMVSEAVRMQREKEKIEKEVA